MQRHKASTLIFNFFLFIFTTCNNADFYVWIKGTQNANTQAFEIKL